ncbi:MAG: phosphoribosyltransferase [Candidatus Thermoplasmatota archaeon]|nr:phosphoribosyltransferase [Candidatus Thermoplasmatota archaeon]MCL5800003.1 phosphoribosyltransferase [Candidatus Thermoplasmatota archaeon]
MQFKARLVEWKEIVDWCDTLRSRIIGSFDPDFIIGLSRGGLVPARILSDSLLIKDLFTLKTEHWGMTANVDGQAVLRKPDSLNVKGRRVLIVDDITDTGESMDIAKKYVQSLGPAALKTSTMLHIDRSKHVPDFFARGVSGSEWTWFIFPWNIHEDLNNLIVKSCHGKFSTGQILEILKDQYDLNISLEVLDSVLADLVQLGKIKKERSAWVTE